ncbi:exopolysaccharide transport family protein [Methylobacterium sp. Leaf117]|uniref:GumC family protein n=1 Tax=Methylobacterium sp. Leaf117 TaxID=1736260 RepID=UPI0006FEE734|nr:exopolysaccharide transport family protein [Methylobacterium sp. Leaf117]KQP96214.1 hypothetical protein ASF57_00105 [Methylobacterium sp. Leaf117]
MAVIERAPPVILKHFGADTEVSSAPLPWFLDMSEVGRILRRRWVTVILPVLLLSALAVGYLALPAQYAATTQLIIDPRGLAVLKDEANPQGQANESTLLLVDSQLRVLQSDDVLRRVVLSQKLASDQDFVEPSAIDRLRTWVGHLVGRASEPESDPTLTALRALRDRMSARRLERSFAVDVSVSTNDREKSARLAQSIAETYLSTEISNRSESIRRAREGLNSRLGELRDSVQQAENAAQVFRNKNNLVGTRTQLVSEQQLGQLSDQLGAARAKAAEQQAKLRQIESVSSSDPAKLDSIQEVLQSQTIGQLRGQLAQVERQRADAAASLGERHPAMNASDVQLRSARNQLEAEVKRIAAAIRNEYRANMANVVELSQALEKRKADALNVGDSFIKLRELERQVDARRGVYEAFLVRTRELQEQQQLDTSTSRIISPALPPTRRQGPPAPLVLAAALLAGVGLGIGGSLTVEQFSGRVRSRKRLEARTQRLVIGLLPTLRRGIANGTDRLSGGPYEIAITRLRNRLRRDLPAKRPHVILVTSADDIVGRSRLALDYAASAAHENERVLLVDASADGTVTREIGLPPRHGGTSMPKRADLSDVLVRHSSGLAMIPQDGQTARSEMRVYVDSILGAQDSYDLVVIHAGLIGSDATAERLAADPRVTAVLVTVRNGESRYAILDKALAAIGGRPYVGMVLTDAEALD